MQKNIKKEVFSWVRTILFALMIAFLFRHFLFTPSIVHGESMAPTFHENDKLILAKYQKFIDLIPSYLMLQMQMNIMLKE